MSVTMDAALTAYAAGDFAGAAAGFEEALRETPDDVGAVSHLAACYAQLGRQTEAVTAQTRCVQLAPGSAEARYQLALYLRGSGWLEQARQAAEQALMLEPTHTAAQALVMEIGAPTHSQAAPQQPSALPNQVPAGIAQPYGAQPGGMPTYLSQPHVEDSFDLRQAARDIWSVITGPNAFFMQQVGREGRKAPCAMILLLAIISIPTSAINYGKLFGWPLAVGILILGVPVLYLFAVVFTHISARILHMVAGWFGSTASLDSTFRAYVYATAVGAPMAVIMLLFAVFSPMSPGFMPGRFPTPPPITGAYAPPTTTGPGAPPPIAASGGTLPNAGSIASVLALFGIALVLELAFGIWMLSVLVIGVSTLHSIPSGTAAGVIVLAGLIGSACLVVAMVIADIVSVAVIAAMSGRS
ncbi:MAG: tetratricopeptide repeat protein [Armatimonadetes bacterium]|nr:tetratricopeptide repeat protein [Armatimonadota bacterium]MDE2207132.1 tetratricopeptide repeat protein [Armatimonadota bacterium]